MPKTNRAGGPPPDRARPTSTDELVEHVSRLFRRLDDHCHAYLVEGKQYRIADVAAVLRTLLSKQRHDNMLPTLFKRLHLSEPSVFVSPEPDISSRVHLSWGSIPAATVSGGAAGWEQATISELQHRTVVVMGPEDGFARIKQSWSDLISDYGNTWGAHVSSTVPLYLDRTEITVGTELPLGHHLLLAMAEALSAAMAENEWEYQDRFERAPITPPAVSPVVGGTVIRTGDHHLLVSPTLSFMPDNDAVLLTTEYRGHRLTIRYLTDGEHRLSMTWADKAGTSGPLTPRPLTIDLAVQGDSFHDEVSRRYDSD